MKKNKKKSFKYQIKRSFILYSLVPITGLTLIFYNILFISFSRWSYSYNKEINSKISQVIETEFLNYEKDIIELSCDSNIINILLENQSIDKDIYENIYDRVNGKKIKSIFHIYNINGESVLTNSVNDYEENQNDSLYDWGKFRKMHSSPEEIMMLLNKIQININTRSVYTIGKAILYKDKIIGFVEFDILENELNNIISCNSDEEVIITDKYNNSIINTNNSLLNQNGKFKYNQYKDNSQLIKTSILDGNIYIYTIKNIDFVKKFFVTGEFILIGIFTLLFILMVYFANRISINNSKSIDTLIKGMEYVQNGDFTRKVYINTNDEFQTVGEYYNEMIDKIKELMKKNEEEVKRATLAQIKHLESQFNPHFLFNTLEMLRYMIKTNDSKSEKVTLSMARILRYSLDNNTRSTCLKDDIKYIEDYLSIQKLRFGDNFDYDIYISEDCRNTIIPKLIIQPIIENSIKYGFQNKEYLFIDIYAEQNDGDMLIQISDNGDGMSKPQLNEINKLLNTKNNNSQHIGLYNVQKRISLVYGEKYGIKIESEEGIGTYVLIKIPIK